MTLIAAALLAALPPQLSQPDPNSAFAPPPWAHKVGFERCALKALAGVYGPLEPWQAQGYQKGLKSHEKRVLVLTCYLGTHSDGKVDRRGRPCTMRTAASNLIPEGAFIWVWDPPAKVGLRQIRDCGAKWNDKDAARRGGVWCDIWQPNARAARAAGVAGRDPRAGVVIGG